jgi:molecular chaperone DnaK (HSP70)
MTGGISTIRRIAVDFGMEQTVIAVQEGTSTLFPNLAGFTRMVPSLPHGDTVPVIPCLIYYGDDGGVLIGEEVVTGDLVHSPATVRWMRHYIMNGNPARTDAKGHGLIGYPDAGAAFLRSLLAWVPASFPGQETEITFVVPLDASEHYLSWIRSIGRAAGAGTTRMIDAVTATICGYDLPTMPEHLYVLIEMEESSHSVTVAVTGYQEPGSVCTSSRILGLAEDETGNARINAWIAEDILLRLRLKESDPRVRILFGKLLQETRRARERLAAVPDTRILVREPASGINIDVILTRDDLVRVLTDHGFLPILHRTIDRAIAAATGRGQSVDKSTAVILTGGCYTIPCLQDEIHHWFGWEKVYGNHPSEARVRGALAAEPVASERIMNDYAVRFWDAGAREHRYRFLVRAGTGYPSAGQVGRFLISATYDGQTRLGVPLYSFGTGGENTGTVIELVSDAAGGIRMSGGGQGTSPEGKPVWVNERTPTLLVASPPAVRGEARFELTFTIDRDRQLCLTARDVLTGEVVRQGAPVYRLI